MLINFLRFELCCLDHCPLTLSSKFQIFGGLKKLSCVLAMD